MKKIISLVIGFAPSLVFAQPGGYQAVSGAGQVVDATSLTQKLVDIGNVIIYLLVALAIIFIVWNVVMALIRNSDPAGKSKALGNIGYGVLGLAIIVSVWGLVNIIVGTFRTNPVAQPIPNIGNNTGTGGIPFNQVPKVQ